MITVFEAPIDCAENEIMLSGALLSGKHQAVSHVSTSGATTLPYNTTVQMIAGDSVSLNPGFNLELGGELQMSIEICEGEAPEHVASNNQEFCSLSNDCTGMINFSGMFTQGCTTAGTELTVLFDQGADETIEFTLSPDQIEIMCSDFTISGNFPIGQHQFVIIAENPFGEDTLKINFDVYDCKAPTPICINGLAIELMSIEPGDVDGDGDEDSAAMTVFAS